MKFAVGFQLYEPGEEPFSHLVQAYQGHISEVFFPWLDLPTGQETEELIRYLLSDRTVDTYTVTFRHNGNVFATQKVTGGECVTVPILLPSMTGGWDFDFTKPIEQDTIIDWKE